MTGRSRGPREGGTGRRQPRPGRPRSRRPPWGLVAVCAGLVLLSVGRAAPPAQGASAGPPVYRMVFPLLGEHRLTDSFGDPRGGGRSHAGIDIMAERMVPVVAVADGTVRWLHDERGGDCCDVALLHDDGWRSRYIHLNNDTPGTDDGRAVGIAPGIEEGARVEAGQIIGWVGDSGNAEGTAPHLHFELRRPDGTPVDALPSLRAALQRGRELGGSVEPPDRRRPLPPPLDRRDTRRETPAPRPDAGRAEPQAEARGGIWRRLLGSPDDEDDVGPAPPMSAEEGEPGGPVDEEEAIQVPRPPLDEEIGRADDSAGSYPELGMDRRVEQVEVGEERPAAGERRSGGLLGCFGFAGQDEDEGGADDTP